MLYGFLVLESEPYHLIITSVALSSIKTTLTPHLTGDMKVGVLLKKPGADFELTETTPLSELNGGAGVLIDEGVADMTV